MSIIRELKPTKEDFEAIVAINNAVWPDQKQSIESVRHREKTRDHTLFHHRVVIEEDDVPAGHGLVASPSWSKVPNRYMIYCEVIPTYRNRGIASLFYQYAIKQLKDREVDVLISFTREDQPVGISFLESRNYKMVQREPRSILYVNQFDESRYADLSTTIAESGIELLPISEISRRDDEWGRKLWQLDNLLMEDVPIPEPYTGPTYDQFVKRTLGSPDFDSNLQFIALDGDKWVGMSALWLSNANPHMLFTGLTGVIRSHRRRRIATALKLKAILKAREMGKQEIETDNEENNPMYRLNMELGFVTQPAWLTYHNTVSSEEANSES